MSLSLADPSTAPGATVSLALRHFRRAVRGRNTLLVTWVQDFSFERPYTGSTRFARRYRRRDWRDQGFMLWNAEGLYTDGALAPP